MDAREAEMLAHRRARALARERTRGDEGALTVTLSITLVIEGQWCAAIRVHAALRDVVDERSFGDDPTAALVALPGVLAEAIEGTCLRLRDALREGMDGLEPEPVVAVSGDPAPRRRTRTRPHCRYCKSETHQGNRCPERERAGDEATAEEGRT